VFQSTGQFMDALEKWLQAARAEDFESARHHAKDIVMNGQMLITNPDFVDRFKRFHADAEPVDALLGMCQFLVCVTDGRAAVLKQACETLAKAADENSGSE
jgi:hypothetical protein